VTTPSDPSQDPNYTELASLSKAERGSAKWRELMRRMHLAGWSIHDLARCAGIPYDEAGRICEED
jgi:hypothetical protein